MRFILFAVMALASISAAAQELSVFFRQSSTAFSESVPIRAFEDDLRGASEPEMGRHAVTFNRIETGVSWGNVEVAYFLREDYVFDYSSDTMEIVYRDKNKIPFADGQVYNVYLKAQHIKAKAFRVGYLQKLPSDSFVRLSVNYYDAEELLYGSLFGQIAVEDGDIAGGNLQVLYQYHEDYLLDRPNIIQAQGKGYSFDINAEFNLGDHWNLKMNLFDLLGELEWEDAPFTEATIASTETYYDSNNYAHRRPFLEAMQNYKDFTQRLPLHYQISLNRHLIGPLSATVERETYDEVDFHRLFLRYSLTEQIFLFSGYDFTSDATWVGAEGKHFSLQVATDDWALIDSKTLVLRISGQMRF